MRGEEGGECSGLEPRGQNFRNEFPCSHIRLQLPMLVTFALDFKCGLHTCKCNRPLAVTSAGLDASVQTHHKGGGV